MRLLWQSFVDATQNPPYLKRLEAYLNEIAAPGTTVEVRGMSPPDRDFGRLTEFRCAIQAVDAALEAEEKKYDGFVMGHFQDPGLYEARSAVRIPVIGTGESTLHFAAQLGRRIALVSIDPVFEVWHHEQAERYGIGHRLAGIAGLGVVPEDFAAAFANDDAAFARLLEQFISCALPLVEQGADVVVPAGVLPALLLARERGLMVGHAPVVNCAAVALKGAEMAVALHRLNGVEPSRGPSFALAPPRAVADFRGFVARGLRND
ncbi:MAG TPA: aspartate/glutamate racemase family protein [Stellaceae bacterium]|nr:aspartate/glutamate racemase family protein [Stellaceae bacterium]